MSAAGAPEAARKATASRDGHSSLAIYRRLLGFTRPYRIGFAAALVAMIIAAATEPLFPALMKPLLDEGFVHKSNFPLWFVPVALIAIFVVRGIATFSSSYALAWVANNVLVDVRTQMFERVMRLPAEQFEREASGLLISRIVFEVTNVTAAVTRALTTIVRDSIVVLGLVGWLVYLNWKLTLVALMLIPVMTVVVSVYSRRMRRLSRQSLLYTGELTRVVEEAVHGYKVIKIFGGYRSQAAVFSRTVDKLRGFAMRMTIAGSATVPITQLSAAIAVAIVVTIALVQSMNEQTTVGGFVSFVTAMLMLLAPLKHLADVNAELQRGLAAAESVFALLDLREEADVGTVSLGRARGRLVFENVWYRYPTSAHDALREIDLDIRAGEVVALVGASGAGKSTLLNLLPRFMDPSRGRILLDGVALPDLRLADLRRQYALVSQEVVLFNDTVRANVALGREDAVDDATIWKALEAARMDTVVRALPDGLDASVGERGTRLSGGQRQRLALARAIVKDAPILLLDEATSALDSATEREVQIALEHTMRGRTTLVIAHRLSTIERADRILVFDHGRIVEQGTHAELLDADSLYARLYRIQYASA
ncbi:MAG: lipid A export permease/ATP-binding protein MsbA [Burkholderiaceae bacterium]|nr:lipid A export permease/ATP-binding protein MsbA [Burkholderiaceae bacterium]